MGCSYAVYSTRKHHPAKPRLRILIPLDRNVKPDEYEAIARYLANIIGMQIMDRSTFEASRLMYWPSCSKDSEFVFVYEDKPFASADGILKTYKNWKDCNEWPHFENETEIIKKEASKQKDPLEKENIVGAFCRVYDIPSVIEKYLPDVYEPGNATDKYTYKNGSVANGAVVYGDGKWLYSYHATDPASRILCNSFDLVRIHKFKELDDDTKDDTPTNRLPSYTEMCRLAMEDKAVAYEFEKTKLDLAQNEFKSMETSKEDNISWRLEKLSRNTTTGAYNKTIANAVAMLTNDLNLKENMIFDRFSNRFLIVKKLPWDRDSMIYPRLWGDSDDAELRFYLEKVYDGFRGKDLINDALLVLKNRNSINVAKQYFENLDNKWDGIPRLETLFVDYLGAEDSIYVRETTKKIFVAAVARNITERPIKFDNMIILTGPQGIGKSTILSKLAGDWFTDNIVDFSSKDTLLILQNCLIAEVAELQSFKKADVNTLKMFLGQQTDKFRAPYERREEEHPRHCVFFGTTNDQEFLRDSTGNRRYWPIQCAVCKPKKSVFINLDSERDQIWAEAVYLFRNGEKLYLDSVVEEEARKQQKERLEVDPWESAIIDYLNQEIPIDWYDKGLDATGEKVQRDRVSVSEILTNCLNISMKQQDRQSRNRVLGILLKLDDWEYRKNIKFGKKKQSSGFARLDNSVG